MRARCDSPLPQWASRFTHLVSGSAAKDFALSPLRERACNASSCKYADWVRGWRACAPMTLRAADAAQPPQPAFGHLLPQGGEGRCVNAVAHRGRGQGEGALGRCETLKLN